MLLVGRLCVIRAPLPALAEKRPEHGSTRGPPTRCAGLLATAARSGVPPVRWLAQARGSVGRNLGVLGRGSRWDRADRHDPGRLCVLWFIKMKLRKKLMNFLIASN